MNYINKCPQAMKTISRYQSNRLHPKNSNRLHPNQMKRDQDFLETLAKLVN